MSQPTEEKRATLEEAENAARGIGKVLKHIMPTGWGFTLILTSYGEGGLLTYLSSCRREDMIKCLFELGFKLEGKEKEL